MFSRYIPGRRFASLGLNGAQVLHRLFASTASLHVARLRPFTTMLNPRHILASAPWRHDFGYWHNSTHYNGLFGQTWSPLNASRNSKSASISTWVETEPIFRSALRSMPHCFV